MNNTVIRILILESDDRNAAILREALLQSGLPVRDEHIRTLEHASTLDQAEEFDAVFLNPSLVESLPLSERPDFWKRLSGLPVFLLVGESTAVHTLADRAAALPVIATDEIAPALLRVALSAALRERQLLTELHSVGISPGNGSLLNGLEDALAALSIPAVSGDAADQQHTQYVTALERIINASHDNAMLLDVDGVVIMSNESGAALFGLRVKEIVGRNILHLLPFELAMEQQRRIDEVLRTCESVIFEAALGIRLFEVRLTPIKNDIDHIGQIAVFAHDITERTLVAQIIENEERKLRGIIDNSPDGIILVNEEGALVEWSPAMERITGLRPEDILGRKIWNVYWELTLSELRTPEMLNDIHTWILQYLRNESDGLIQPPNSVWIELNDGRRKCVETTTFPVNAPQGRLLANFVRDITDIKLAELEIHRKSDELHTLLRAIPDMVYFKDLEGRYRICNQAICDFFGKASSEVIGRTDFELLPEDFARQIHNADRNLLEKGASLHVEDVLFPDTPARRYFDTIKVPLRDKEGVIIGLAGISRDVTLHRLADEALRQSEQVHRELIAAFPDMLFVFDDTLRIIDYHVEAEQKAVFSATGGRGRILHERIPGPEGVQLEEFVRQFFLGGDLDRMEFRLGPPYFLRQTELEARLRRVGDNVVALVRDITEEKENRRMLEEQNIILSERNSELDTFTHSVAHDLKNPLSLIIGYAELINEESGQISPEELKEFADSILFNAKKMVAIINALLLLASVRKEDVEPQEIDMQAIVHDAIRRLRKPIAERGASISLPEGWIPVKGYAPWIEEVWVNYISNAVKYGGTPCEAEIGMDDLDTEVRYWIRDNGSGIPEEKVENLFRPFTRFSQLDVEGHGLGLSIVGRIINKLGGTVDAKSSPDGGGVFSFTLPKS